MEPIQDDPGEVIRGALQRLEGVKLDVMSALDRLVAERDRLIQGIGALVERILNTADPDLSEYDAGKMYVVQELEALTKEE